MFRYQLENDESVLLEKKVFYGNKDKEHKLVITNKNLLFEREMGIFKREYKVVDRLPFDDIKVYKDQVQMKVRKNKIIVQTVDGDLEFRCVNVMDTGVVADKISYVKTGANFIRRTTKKAKNIVSVVTDVGLLVGVVVGGTCAAVKLYNSNKDKVVDVLNTIRHR